MIDAFEAQKPDGGRLQHMADDLLQLQEAKNRNVIVSHQGERLQRLLAEQGVDSSLTEEILEVPDPKTISVLKATLAEGWRHPDSQLVLITDSELFGRKTARRLRKGASNTDRTFLADLKTGDFVVHVEHGIGRFQGIVQMTESSGQREYLALEYMGTDRLYIPVDQIGRIQKYVGMSDREPKLNRLGTAGWTKAKKEPKDHPFNKSTRQQLKDMILGYDKYLISGDARRKEPKKFGGSGARRRKQKSYR